MKNLIHMATEILTLGVDHWVTLRLDRRYCSPPLQSTLYVDGNEVARLSVFLLTYVKVDRGTHHFTIRTREGLIWATPEEGVDVENDVELRVFLV